MFSKINWFILSVIVLIIISGCTTGVVEEKSKIKEQSEQSEIDKMIKDCKSEWSRNAAAGVNLAFDIDQCYLKYAQEKNDPNICRKYIKEQNTKDMCFWEFGRGMNNESLCKEISDESWDNWKQSCLEWVWSHVGNIETCAKYNNTENIKDLCLYNVAIGKKDSQICKNIESEYFINKCNNKFAD